MGVLINNNQNRLKIPQKIIKQTAQAILNALECPEGELSILIVDDPQIAELNEQYLNRRGPTNVIAFPMQEGDFSNISPHLLGDVVISIDTAEKEGQKSEISVQERFTQLLIHGILHLFGFDHEKSEEDFEKMDAKSNELFKTVYNKDEKWPG